jgi:hypothetical protein
MQMTFVDALEAEAVEQLGAIREFRAYQGSNPEYTKRAKMAVGVIGAYVRLRATMANERSNELIARRLDGIAPRELTHGSAEHASN